jgi:hypothetical protein
LSKKPVAVWVCSGSLAEEPASGSLADHGDAVRVAVIVGGERRSLEKGELHDSPVLRIDEARLEDELAPFQKRDGLAESREDRHPLHARQIAGVTVGELEARA